MRFAPGEDQLDAVWNCYDEILDAYLYSDGVSNYAKNNFNYKDVIEPFKMASKKVVDFATNKKANEEANMDQYDLDEIEEMKKSARNLDSAISKCDKEKVLSLIIDVGGYFYETVTREKVDLSLSSLVCDVMGAKLTTEEVIDMTFELSEEQNDLMAEVMFGRKTK